MILRCFWSVQAFVNSLLSKVVWKCLRVMCFRRIPMTPHLLGRFGKKKQDAERKPIEEEIAELQRKFRVLENDKRAGLMPR